MSQTGNKAVIGQEVIALYDEYTHVPLPRRVFLKRLTAIMGSTAAVSAILPFLENNYAAAQIVPVSDARVVATEVGFPTPLGRVTGYLATPAGAPGRRPAVMVIHENRGLNPHIEDVARRLALAGFVALAPDYLTGKGGTPTDADRARELIGTLDAGSTLSVSLASLTWLKDRAQGNGKVGVVGFCWGGAAANQLAVEAPDLNAAVVFYGMQPKAEDVARIRAPLLLHYAGLDARINAGIGSYEAALRAAGKIFTVHMYEGVNHAFHNDTNAARYDPEAAQLAWQRTLDFLHLHLG